MSALLDDPRAQIDNLHADAEDLRDLARRYPEGSPMRADFLRRATRKVQQAARLRAQVEG